MDQSVSNRLSRSMAPRKLSAEEKKDKRIYEKQRKISSNIRTLLADIIRVKRKIKKKIGGYNQAEAFELYKTLKTVFKEVDRCRKTETHTNDRRHPRKN